MIVKRVPVLLSLAAVLAACAWLLATAEGPVSTDATPPSAARGPSTPRPTMGPAAGAPAAVPGGSTDPTSEVIQPAHLIQPARPGHRVIFGDEAPRDGELGAVARALLDEHADALGLAAMPGDLRLEREFDSLLGRHLRFVQVVDQVPVHRSDVGVHVDPDGRPLYLAADVFPVEGVATRPDVSARDAARAAAEFLEGDDDEGLRRASPARLVILPEGRGGRLVWQVDARTESESIRVFVDAATGDAHSVEPLQCSDGGLARLFDPNPVHSRRDPTLRDRRDADQPILTNETVLVDLARLDGSGFLRGTWADVTFTSNALSSPTYLLTAVTRSSPHFEQIMCYHHVDQLQEYLQGLGITNANAEAQGIDARAMSEDQSIFDVADDRLLFGTGGVDDAEDADIIRHEYGHAIQFDQIRSFGLGGETGALGEGFGDYLAACFHDSGSEVYDAAVGSWDAVSYSNANPPALRRVDGNKRYPGDIEGQVHADGEIWSAFLWDLQAAVGRDDTLRLVIESHFLYTSGAKFKDAANSLLIANRSLRDGELDETIRELLLERGLPFTVPPPPPPSEDAFEENDSLLQAALLPLGLHEDLLLADEDWFRVQVPPHRRVNVLATFAASQINLDLEVRTPAGTVLSASRSLESTESVHFSAGAEGAEYFVRVFDGSIGVGLGGYTLSVTETDLELLPPGENRLLTMKPGRLFVYRVPVAVQKVERRAKLKLRTKRNGRRGAVNDLRLFDPAGNEVVPFGERQQKKGAKVVLVPEAAGFWIVEVRARDDAEGSFKLKARLRR